MRSAILSVVEGASRAEAMWDDLVQQYHALLGDIRFIKNDILEATDKEIGDEQYWSGKQGPLLDKPSKQEEMIRFQREILPEVEKYFLRTAPAPGNGMDQSQQPADSSSWPGFQGQSVQSGADEPDLLTKLARKRKWLKTLGRLEKMVSDEIDKIGRKSKILAKEKKFAHAKFFGALEIQAAGTGQSAECSTACEEVVELLKDVDYEGAQACICLNTLIAKAMEEKQKGKSLADLDDALAQWNQARNWEKFDLTETVKALLSAPRVEFFDQVDSIAQRAANYEDENSFTEANNLRQLLCLDHTDLSQVLQGHVRRVTLRAFESKHGVLEDGAWPPVTRPRVLRAMLCILRTSLGNFFDAKQKLYYYEESPLHLERRQAIVSIGEMASAGNCIATDYLLDVLSISHDWTVRQITLGCLSRILRGAKQRDQLDITLKLLKATLMIEEEHDVVQETAETLMIQLLKSGMKEDAGFLENLDKFGTRLMAPRPFPSRHWDTWERIKKEAFTKEGSSRLVKSEPARKGRRDDGGTRKMRRAYEKAEKDI